MSWLPIYADTADFSLVLSWLNNDAEIAFIVSDGPKRWMATSSVEGIRDGRYCLWHQPSGPLPLLLSNLPGPDSIVPDPWKGWTEVVTGADSTTPYFGSGHPGVIWLNARTSGDCSPGAIGLSSFEWIGNGFRIIGRPAPDVTEKWWQRLRRLVKKVATRIPRQGPYDGANPEIWAFPSAYQKVLDGTPRDLNP